MAAAPKVMLSPQHAVRLRTVAEHIDANVTTRIGWRSLAEALRRSGNLTSLEDVEAFVIDDEGINIFVRHRPSGFDDRDEVIFRSKRSADATREPQCKTVPIEPTQKMLDAALRDYLDYERQGPRKPPWNARTMWRAMLSAWSGPDA